jgi:hypothetical protein
MANIGNEPNVHAGLMFACELARACRGKSEARLPRLRRFADVDDKRERVPQVPPLAAEGAA